MEKRWARLAVQAQCSGILDFHDPPNRNGLAELREKLLLDAVEREQNLKAVQVMLLAQAALRGSNKQLVVALMDEGLQNLRGPGGAPAGLPATGALDVQQMEAWYAKVRDNHRKQMKRAKK